MLQFVACSSSPDNPQTRHLRVTFDSFSAGHPGNPRRRRLRQRRRMGHDVHDCLLIFYLLIGHALRHFPHTVSCPPRYTQYVLVHSIYHPLPHSSSASQHLFFFVSACRPLCEYQKLMYISLSCYLYIDHVLYCTVVFNRSLLSLGPSGRLSSRHTSPF